MRGASLIGGDEELLAGERSETNSCVWPVGEDVSTTESTGLTDSEPTEAPEIASRGIADKAMGSEGVVDVNGEGKISSLTTGATGSSAMPTTASDTAALSTVGSILAFLMLGSVPRDSTPDQHPMLAQTKKGGG